MKSLVTWLSVIVGFGIFCGVAISHAEEQVYRYTVTGEIRQLPKRPGAEVFIRHDPIPDYVGRDGKVVGMAAMTMPFWLGANVSLEGFQVGDKVRFSLESRWEPKASDTITAISKVTEGELSP